MRLAQGEAFPTKGIRMSNWMGKAKKCFLFLEKNVHMEGLVSPQNGSPKEKKKVWATVKNIELCMNQKLIYKILFLSSHCEMRSSQRKICNLLSVHAKKTA